MIVADTSALSRVMHRDATALAWLASHRPSEVILCAPVAAEIAFGLERLGPRTRKRTLLEAQFRLIRAAVVWADWTEAGARWFGIIKAQLRNAGTPVDDMDIAIASVALALDAGVATCNRKHFEAVADLRVEDWSRARP